MLCRNRFTFYQQLCGGDERDQKVLYDKRLPNQLATIEQALEPYAKYLEGIVVKSTYNWYWLVDGLVKKDYKVNLAHTGSVVSSQIFQARS